MKAIILLCTFCLTGLSFSCNQPATDNQNVAEEQATAGGQSQVQDDVSAPDIVKIAVGSSDHSTLVAALKAGELVNALSNAGPFTVFAPTNAAFEKLPAGTVEELLKPEKKAALQNILQYHVWVGVLSAEALTDGRSLNMVNGDNATIHKSEGKLTINEANIVGSVRASNGVIHIIDGVLLPPEKK